MVLYMSWMPAIIFDFPSVSLKKSFLISLFINFGNIK
jgi:hypothetical protein